LLLYLLKDSDGSSGKEGRTGFQFPPLRNWKMVLPLTLMGKTMKRIRLWSSGYANGVFILFVNLVKLISEN
jgi:hypothetical protein